MRVLIVNTSERTGGAAIAANRLCQALNDNGVKATMMVRDKQTDSLTTVSVPCPRWHFLWERMRILLANRFSRRNLWQADIANTGVDITTTKEFQEADVIHLHWINQGFLSLDSIEKIIRSGKGIIWTLHDQWPYTAICHYADKCDRYHDHCHDCPLLANPSRTDLSYQVFNKKQRLWSESGITLVGCSQWIADGARQSDLTRNLHITTIPNPIPADIFHPMPQAEVRRQLGLPTDKPLILFVCQKVTDERKGMKYLLEALKKVEGAELVVAGNNTLGELPCHAVGYIDDERQMAKYYAAADVFVTPSLQDNLPNTIAEAMSCGTPCVGFNVGGIPEMIHHQADGYVAQLRDADDLAEGIRYLLTHPELREAAAHTAAKTYNPSRVALAYIKEYER